VNNLSISAITKTFGSTSVLRGVDLELPGGELSAIVGVSGSGKTTLLRIIAGFEYADRGSIRVGENMLVGADIHIAPEHRRIGIVPQDGALFPHLSVEGNIAFGLPANVRRSSEGRARVIELLELVGLTGYQNRMPTELSGGQQQRVAVARCLAPRPDVVLLDEPFSALDASLRGSVRHDVAAALKAAGTTSVLVTHDQDEALAMASLVAVIDNGIITQAADPYSLYHFPNTVKLAEFVGEAVVVSADVDNEVARCALGTLRIRKDFRTSTQHSSALVMLRPEQFVMKPMAAGDTGAPGVITHVEFHGHDALVRVHGIGDTSLLCRVIDRVTYRVGDAVSVLAHGDVVAYPME
jgi:iron(III) transport system ATP-binding protein